MPRLPPLLPRLRLLLPLLRPPLPLLLSLPRLQLHLFLWRLVRLR